MPPEPKRRYPLSYAEEAAKAGVMSSVPLGVRPIRVKRVVGSAGKAGKIGPDFLPLRSGGSAKGSFDSISRLMKAGEELPPISVYGLGSRYFVVDGHTRVAAARALGVEYLDANVTEMLPRREGEANLTTYARREFERYTGLEGIRLTGAWRYHLLHHHIEGYRLYMERSTGHDVSLAEAARVWNRTQYMPTLLEIRRRKLKSTTGGRTAGDVYTDVLKAWAEEEGLAVSLREMLDRFDASSERSVLDKAKRVVTDVMDATLPKAIPPIGKPRATSFAETDVQQDLDAATEQQV